LKSYFLITFILFAGKFICQELELNDGIYIEQATPKDTTKHKYSKDNISYKLNMTFVYDYYYMDTAGKKYKFMLKKDPTEGNLLNLVSFESKTFDIINRFKFEINDDENMFGDMPDYTQTVFGISYLRLNGKVKDTLCEEARKKIHKLTCYEEGTGIIDNKMNLWMHPPRSYTFRILQLCPYPFQYLNEAVKTWGWTLETGGDHYLEKRWIDTKGQSPIKIKYEHTRVKDEIIETPLGKINCKVVLATGTCESLSWFKTGLKSYYNPSYGFVRLEYDLINGDKMVIWLEQVKAN